GHRGADTVPFVGQKEESFIAFDRPCYRATELVRYRIRLAAQEWRTGVERGSRIALHQAAVPLVGSRLRDHADVATHAAIFGGDDTLDDLHFSDGFGAHDLDLCKVAVHAEHLRARIAAGTAAVDAGAHRSAAQPVQFVARAAHGVGSEVVPAQAGPGGSDDC